jgi:uncharacterized protein with NAD-binding domain and iron-sulfur cluster
MTEAITTPASRDRRPTVAILGAGIAGLTAAHELAERGFDVTVYEPREDERTVLGTKSAATYPPVKLGGLAASQYSTTGPLGNEGTAELRPFPGRRGRPRAPERAVAGEHGFRFFPAYYLHIWDMFQRIPVYSRSEQAGSEVSPTSRTVMDNVRRVVTQGTTVDGKPSLVFPRERPRTLAELLTAAGGLAELGFTVGDVQAFVSRLLRYLVTSPLRRASELQNLSAYDFFIGRDAAVARRFYYTPRFDGLLLEMPRVLAAFDSHWGDARTNLTTYLQLQLQMDRRDNKADGVLNGPTTESWFDHWYRHLVELGVRFVRTAADRLQPPVVDPRQPPHLRPRVQVALTDGVRVAADYTVVAVDAPAAERITAALREAGTGGTVAGLDGFATSAPPPDGPLQSEMTRPRGRRDPYSMDQMGRVPWDRFQTLAGIQYFFDTEFQLLRGHMYYSGTEWALSSINQHGLWECRPTLTRDGHVSVLSVDIGDFNTPSRHLAKAARDCTADELATEVWRQIVRAITSDVDNVPEALVPWPAWYALDRNLIMTAGPGQGESPAVRNKAPYLVPIVGDWPNRPGADPWNPNGSSWTTRPAEARWLEDLEQRNVWQARHGGYQVHHNSVVFAGTWTKTFTRMTSMEAACESGRHAVNAILDHYIWVESGGIDRREKTTLDWRVPFGFQQNFSTPIRMPSPAGDYCYVFDIENREPLDTRALRNLDTQYYLASLPHPLDPLAASPIDTTACPVPPNTGGRSMTNPTEYTQQLLAYLQAWRQYLEQATGAETPGQPYQPAPWPIPATPPASFVPPMPPTPASPMTILPTDYTQQLLAYLQAWRQYLEYMMGAAALGQPGPTTLPPTLPPLRPAAQESVPRDDSDASKGAREPAPAPRVYEAAPNGASLYDTGRVTSSAPNRESRPGSAYPEAAEPAYSGASAQTAPGSLYSSPAASTGPTTWWETGRRYERRAVSKDDVELLAPDQGQSKSR